MTGSIGYRRHLVRAIAAQLASGLPLQLQVEEEPMKRQTVWTLALLAGLAFDASAQQFVYPAKGQSPEQQKSAEAACYTWAVQQSGFDPAKPPPAAPAPAPAAKPPTTATGTTPGAGVRGAARGAVVGEIVADDAGAGAAVGAVAARGQSRRQNQAAAQQQQQQQQAAAQQQQAAVQQQQAAYNKARAACLEGRGYTVK
jgi:hypothetical protein